MTVDELQDKLELLPGNALIQLQIDDRLHDSEFTTDLLHVNLSGWFQKEEWTNNEKLNQYVYLQGTRK